MPNYDWPAWRKRQQDAIDSAIRLAQAANNRQSEKGFLEIRRLHDHLVRELEDSRLRHQNAEARISAYLGHPTEAPVYEGYGWTGQNHWAGPFCLVRWTRVPYPGYGDILPSSLPDIETPDRKTLCGLPFKGNSPYWPRVYQVCGGCVSRAKDMGIEVRLNKHAD